MAQNHVLKEELAYFEELKPELLKRNSGQYALIKGREFVGAFTTAEQAYIAGVKKFGSASFLVRQIRGEEIIHKIPALHMGLLSAGI